MALLENPNLRPDLLVCRGRYIDASTGALGRSSVFHTAGFLSSSSYRRALMLGSTPPHQATFVGPRVRHHFPGYNSDYRLSADLDYF